jgi:hypothetical protein
VSHHPVRELEDGTRVYSNFTTYTPVPDEQRKYKRRRPDDPRAVRWGGEWLLPLDVLPDGDRTMPATKPFKDPASPASRKNFSRGARS